MEAVNCKHIRLKDVDCGMDVEKFIERVENQYKINFKTLPQWKDIIKKLNFVSTYCDRKMHEVNTRKLHIINKLYIENVRQSPFEMTDKLARTADFWLKSQWMNQQKDRNKYIFKNNDGPVPSAESSSRSSMITDTSSRITALEEEAIIDDFEKNIVKGDNSNIRNAPINISSNPHKLLSELDLQYSDLSYHSIHSIDLNEKSGSSSMSCQNFNFQLIKCYPKNIVITSSSFEEQAIEFSLQNMSTYCCSVIFKNIRNRRIFKKAKVFPYLTVKLYPGLSFVFKFVFKLIQTKVDFSSNIFFRVQYRDSKETFLSELCIPITTQFIKPLYIEIPNSVIIPPVYEWHLNHKSKCPFGILRIAVKDEDEYYMRIIKIKKDLSEGMSFGSINTITLDTESIINRNEDSESFNEINSWSTKSSHENEIEEDNDENFILTLIKDVIEIALEPFIFDATWLYLPPNAVKRIRVSFNKSEHTGYHQNYYNVEFRDFDTHELIETKTIKVYAEILPHPLIFYPTILDMGYSPILYGACVDHFVVTNTNKVFPVTIKIEMSPDTKELISITPMKDIILPKSSLQFYVKTCSSEFTSDIKSEDMVHFTIKIIATGDKSIYENMPPIYYEIIAPCALEFNKIHYDNDEIL